MHVDLDKMPPLQSMEIGAPASEARPPATVHVVIAGFKGIHILSRVRHGRVRVHGNVGYYANYPRGVPCGVLSEPRVSASHVVRYTRPTWSNMVHGFSRVPELEVWVHACVYVWRCSVNRDTYQSSQLIILMV